MCGSHVGSVKRDRSCWGNHNHEKTEDQSQLLGDSFPDEHWGKVKVLVQEAGDASSRGFLVSS